MFERLKKAFAGGGGTASAPAAASQVAQWASDHGLSYTPAPEGRSGFTLDGMTADRPWRMELGRPSRNFIRGEELRARAELGIPEDVAVLVMNRPLKASLEKKAYALYTDQLQTSVDPNLPEEMRWLAMYEEFAWEELSDAFWTRYAVMADQRENAMAWVDAMTAELLLSWPDPGPSSEVPFMLMLLRGKAYLRMEYAPARLQTLQHATDIFAAACASAQKAFGPDIVL